MRNMLARALFDAPPVLYEGFAYTVYDNRVPPCKPEHMLADRFIAELDHGGWELASCRGCSREDMTPARARRELYDMLVFCFDFNDRARFAKMGSRNPAEAGEARKWATEKLCETFRISQAVLVRRQRVRR